MSYGQMLDRFSKKEPPQRLRPAWKGREVLIVFGCVILCNFLLALLAPLVKRAVGYYALAYFLQAAVFGLLPFAIACEFYKQPPAVLGMQRNMRVLSLVFTGAAYGAALFAITIAVQSLQLVLLGMSPIEQEMLIMLGSAASSFERVLMVCCLVFIAPIGEEIFFRGFLFTLLEENNSQMLAVLYSALIFGILHGNMQVLLPSLAAGIALALIYARHRNIWCNIIAHMTWNFISVGIYLNALTA
ncbi:MAG: CPBP family intramembrane metalloprotease [Firmicutes bacterium]|nr:CPBP family intramembrane metalloprotease [Bacillota bacterium]MBR6824529.1 CPBP family intramembrane metalloprotease [Bacillota bacterium]MBR7113604.1 CPBP family intramembrane metalloprotease [Bacillota bacterium]